MVKVDSNHCQAGRKKIEDTLVLNTTISWLSDLNAVKKEPVLSSQTRDRTFEDRWLLNTVVLL